MWKLTIEDDEGKQTSLPLAHDEYGVGRAEDNAIRLTDRNVSRKHAALKKTAQGWFIKDLASYNGTYINGTRVAGEQLISNGDVVQLGDYRLELIDEALSQPAIPTSAEPAPMPAGFSVPPAHHRPDRLVVVVGPTPGAEYPLDREHFNIGRAEDATISINHSSVSRLHAELISIGNGRYEIVDKQSANGIRINGVELRRGILEAGDALELGDVRMRFVGAGKTFRAGADQSQQLAVVSSFESVAPSVRAPAPVASAPGRRGGAGKWVMVGAGVGVGLVAVLLLMMKPPTVVPTIDTAVGASPTSTGPTHDVGRKLLDEAVALLKSGDFDGAHKKALQIPENSPLRDDPAFKEIESRWADSVFAKVDQLTADPAEQKRLLETLLATPTVDPETRRKALDRRGQIDAAVVEPIPPPSTGFPNVAISQPPGPGPVPVAPPPNNSPYPPPTPGPGAAAPPRTADPPAAPPPPSGAMDDESMRRSLLPKAASGRASETELRMLKAACRNLGDNVCKATAQRMLDQLKK